MKGNRRLIKSARLMIFLSLLIITSCIEKEKTSKNEIVKESNSMTTSLISKWDALLISDSINECTYWFQETLIEHKKPLAIKGKIADIYKTDSDYVLQVILDDFNNKYIAQISVDSLRMEKLKKEIGANKEVEGCFVVKVVKVKSYSPSIELEQEAGSPPDQDGNGGADPYIKIGDMGADKITTFKGNLLDYILDGN